LNVSMCLYGTKMIFVQTNYNYLINPNNVLLYCKQADEKNPF